MIAGVVVLPPGVDEALTADMERQKRRTLRLRRLQQKAPMANKAEVSARVNAAESALRAMRVNRFHAEDAAIAAVAEKSLTPFQQYADAFRGTARLLAANAQGA